MTKGLLANEQRRELARLYYMQGMQQKEIAERVGVSRNSVSAWVRSGQWDTQRAARSITRAELVRKMLHSLDEQLESGLWSPAEIVKVAAAIEKLDKQTNVVIVIEVFTAFSRWLVVRMESDPELTPELVKQINAYQDLFVSSTLNNQLPQP